MRVPTSFWLVVGVAIVMGCVSTHQRERPFSDDWADLLRAEEGLRQREAYIESDGPLVLFGDEESARAEIGKDEEGDPVVNITGVKGLSTDVGYDHGPEAEVKYRINWNFSKPKRR